MNGIHMHQFQVFDGELWEMISFGAGCAEWIFQGYLDCFDGWKIS